MAHCQMLFLKCCLKPIQKKKKKKKRELILSLIRKNIMYISVILIFI